MSWPEIVAYLIIIVTIVVAGLRFVGQKLLVADLSLCVRLLQQDDLQVVETPPALLEDPYPAHAVLRNRMCAVIYRYFPEEYTENAQVIFARKPIRPIAIQWKGGRVSRWAVDQGIDHECTGMTFRETNDAAEILRLITTALQNHLRKIRS